MLILYRARAAVTDGITFDQETPAATRVSATV